MLKIINCRLLEEYKEKNILKKGGYKQMVKIQFAVYNKVIPQSVLGKALLYAVFGWTMPFISSKEHFNRPNCPFRVITDNDEWKRLTRSLYPRRIRSNEDGETESDLEDKPLLTDQQYQNIYEFDLCSQASYITTKLK